MINVVVFGPKFWKKLDRMKRNKKILAPEAIVNSDFEGAVSSGTRVRNAMPGQGCG